MAVGVDVIRTTGRLIFDLQRGEDTTTRSIEIPYPNTDTSGDTLQNLVNTANTTFTNADNSMNKFIQPSNWRDTNVSEAQWITLGVRYEIVTTSTTPITPDEPETLAASSHEEQS